MRARTTILTIASTLAMTGVAIAIPTAAQAAATGCLLYSSTSTTVTFRCTTVTYQTTIQAVASCHKGGSHPVDTNSYGPLKGAGIEVYAAATCPAGFTVTGATLDINLNG